MATETAAVAVAQTGETQNTEVALTAAPDTEWSLQYCDWDAEESGTGT